MPHRWVCGVVGAEGDISWYKGDVPHELKWEQQGSQHCLDILEASDVNLAALDLI